MISGKPDTQRCVRPVWEGGEASPFRRISRTLPHDSTVFLGGKEKSTLKDLEEALGDETIDLFNESKTYSTNESSGVNYNKTGRKLKNMFELNTMDRDKCIVQISGLPPFFSDKYDPKEHPNYKYTADADEKNIFDFRKYRKELEDEMNVGVIKFHKNDQYKVIL